jgi:hypothetical protein
MIYNQRDKPQLTNVVKIKYEFTYEDISIINEKNKSVIIIANLWSIENDLIKIFIVWAIYNNIISGNKLEKSVAIFSDKQIYHS